MATHPVNRRGRWTFRLRTFLVVVLLLSFALGFVGREAVRIQKQRAIIESCEDQGGAVRLEYSLESYRSPFKLFASNFLGEEVFAEVVSIRGHQFSDRHLLMIARLPSIRELDISYSPISGDISPLLNLKGLRKLNLASTRVDDSSLDTVSVLHAIRDLNLSDCHISDRGIRHLASWEDLEELRLYRTGCSDESVDTLSLMTNLKWLNVEFTEMSPAAVDVLRGRLPQCRILWRSDRPE